MRLKGHGTREKHVGVNMEKIWLKSLDKYKKKVKYQSNFPAWSSNRAEAALNDKTNNNVDKVDRKNVAIFDQLEEMLLFIIESSIQES